MGAGAGLVIRSQLERGDAAGALETCADVAAFARNDAPSSGLTGSLRAAGTFHRVVPACAAAVDAASPAAKRRFLGELQTLRRSALSFAEVLEIERVETELMAFGQYLARGQRERLPPNVRDHLGWQYHSLAHDAAPLFWGKFGRASDARIVAAKGPDRDAELIRVEHRYGNTVDIVAWGAEESWGRDPDRWASLARRHDRLARELALLEAFTSADLGDAPDAGEFRLETEDGGVLRLLLHPDVQP